MVGGVASTRVVWREQPECSGPREVTYDDTMAIDSAACDTTGKWQVVCPSTPILAIASRPPTSKIDTQLPNTTRLVNKLQSSCGEGGR